MDLSDRARDIRAGEELDSTAIEVFLKDCIPDLQGPLSIKQFRSGHSKL